VGELWIYLGFFATLVAAGLGLPAPEELVISGAGVLAGQLPPEPQVVDVPVVYASPADVAGLLAVNPSGGLPGAVPWAALVRASTPRELSNAEVVSLQAAGLLAVNPSAGSLGGLPWPALGGASPPIVEKPLPPTKSIYVRWWIMLPVCILGVVLSDILLYSLGRWFGDQLLQHRWLARVLPPQRRRQTEENFHRYGVSILVVGRLMPGIRAPLFLTAGSMRLPLARFLLADGLGAVVGNSLFFFLGYWLGDSVKTLIEHAEERLKPILIIVAIGLVVAYLLWHFLRHPVPTGAPEEVPIIGPQVASHMESPDPPCPKEPPGDGAAKEKYPSGERPASAG
jgi:membrane protein DedA with SNARE-associated domain